ncbi:indolepyruvate ferredoxin oxidoreductase family protein [Variovorax sp. PBL-E5]|uniref:indolepyruvate ferredoxin oxidoreductase family protein n=1 Tax=Variovorax sp. PBL-E5 TaxID=434014 RepID=UPI0013160992|nr:indolepyruvate ferredoxin oxidoreductase family protein [Variovorax sp. PBL-E5]VTU39939.1 2-oxoacid ferredoxin oxidoreductase [Variovorax sp. PBL-E5]
MNSTTDALYLTTLDDRYDVEEGRIFLNGMQALLRVMLDQRRTDLRNGLQTAGFVSGYPGSPVGGVDDVMVDNRDRLASNHIVFQPGLNEELAATAVFGTQTLHALPGARYDGVFGMWYGKSPGVDRAADALHHANFRGVGRNGGVLVVAGDDPHARSTIYPSDSNWLMAGSYMPILAPANIQEVLDFGLHGFAMSRASGLWVGFKLVTDVADSCASALVGHERVRPVLPEVMLDGAPVRPKIRINEAGPPLLEAERQIYYGQLEVVREYARLNGLNRIACDPPEARIGILTCGKTYVDVRQALTNLGLSEQDLHAKGIRIMTMGLLYPVEPTLLKAFARGLDEIVVVEDKRPMLELFLKDLLYALPDRPVVVGKQDEAGGDLLPAHGELSADRIATALAKRFARRGLIAAAPASTPDGGAVKALVPMQPLAVLPVLPSRTPYFCSGCPHNRSLRVPEGSVVGAGIGCHVMALWMGPVYGEVTGYTQMGGEGAQWVGLAPFTEQRHFFQNLGDGTFHHSGSLAIRFAVSAGTNLTYKILYNRAVAMTGGQDVTGALGVPAMVDLLKAEGVKKIIVTTDDPGKYPGRKAGSAEVWHRDRLVEAEAELAAIPGVTVLINDQQCAAEKRRLRKRGKLAYQPKVAVINERVCEGCGDCGRKSNCLSVQPLATEFGRKTKIHQSSCNQDFSCLEGDCPSFVTIESTDGTLPKPAKKKAVPFPQDVQLPEPESVARQGHFAAGLIGIGGTGVVTVNQILGMAAFLDGSDVQCYDHTGSSQKAGPVVSHLKIFERGEVVSPTVSAGAADLYLAFDALGAVTATNLAMTSPERTIAVVSTSKVPTGEMVSNVQRSYPAQSDITQRIAQRTRSDRGLFFDAQGLAESLLGDHMANNLLMVGAAFQLGALPIRAASIEAAIRLNGTAVESNLNAFRWGRLQVAEPERVQQAIVRVDAEPARTFADPVVRRVAATGATGELAETLKRRVAELIEFQDEAYAQRYLDELARILSARRDPRLAMAVARNLYKLMAYKDEYEVARLHLLAESRAALSREYGDGARMYWHFHPTFLRALGVRKKLRLGAWFRPVLAMLRAMKKLRGTRLDLLGTARLRRIERALPAYYIAQLEAACALPDADLDLLVELAEAPDLIRGYEDVKRESLVTRYLPRVAQLQRQLGIQVAPGAEISKLAVDATAAEPSLKAA